MSCVLTNVIILHDFYSILGISYKRQVSSLQIVTHILYYNKLYTKLLEKKPMKLNKHRYWIRHINI